MKMMGAAALLACAAVATAQDGACTNAATPSAPRQQAESGAAPASSVRPPSVSHLGRGICTRPSQREGLTR